MRRRALTRPVRALATGAGLVALVLSSAACDPGRPPAATVEGREISTERLDDLISAFVDADEDQFGTQLDGEGEDTYQMAAVSSILETLVLQVAQAELAEREGAEPSEDERSEAEDLVRTGFTQGADQVDPATGEPSEAAAEAEETSTAVFDALSSDTREWLVDLRAATLALSRVASEAVTDPEEQAREIYEQDPSAFDRVCLRALVVQEPDLPAVQERLEAGEDFGAVSTEVSIDEELVSREGSMGQCVPESDLGSYLPPDVVTLIAPLEVGQVSEVLSPGDGTAVLFELEDRQPAAFEDVREQLLQTLPDPGEQALADLVEGSIGDLDVEIDPRFGTWHTGEDTCERLDPARGPRPTCLIPPEGARIPPASSDDAQATSEGSGAPETAPVDEAPVEPAPAPEAAPETTAPAPDDATAPTEGSTPSDDGSTEGSEPTDDGSVPSDDGATEDTSTSSTPTTSAPAADG